jgi:hypothetical protein
MDYRFHSENAKDTIVKDINSGIKYLKSGYHISGDIKGDKVTLYLADRHGKHSDFMNERFYGVFSEKTLKGAFRPANYAIVLLVVLFVVAVESIVMSFVSGQPMNVILPAIIVVAEFLYLFGLKRMSREDNKIISEYLMNL